MPVEHEEPLLVSGSSQYSDSHSPSQHAHHSSLPPNPNLHIYTSPSPTHQQLYTNPPTQSYHVSAPQFTNGAPHQLPPLLLYPTGAPNAQFAPMTAIPMAMDTVLVRTTYAFSWLSWDRQYAFSLDLPAYASPHLPAYLTGIEWANSMARLNDALRWLSWVQAVRLLSLLVTLGAAAMIWSKEVRQRKPWTIACWTALLAAGITFVLLTRLYAGRVRKQLLQAVEAEHAHYQHQGEHSRQGKLQSAWRMDGRWLIVSAPTQAPAGAMPPISYIMTPAHIGDAGRAASIHYQHSTEMSHREEQPERDTPMEHF